MANIDVQAITAIYLGLNTADEITRLACNFCNKSKKENHNIALYKAEIHETDYALTFSKLKIEK